MQENHTKISKIKQLEANGARWATMGHLVALPSPTMVPTSVAPLVPPDQSVGNGQEIYFQAFSTVASKSVHGKGQKEASH